MARWKFASCIFQKTSLRNSSFSELSCFVRRWKRDAPPNERAASLFYDAAQVISARYRSVTFWSAESEAPKSWSKEFGENVLRRDKLNSSWNKVRNIRDARVFLKRLITYIFDKCFVWVCVCQIAKIRGTTSSIVSLLDYSSVVPHFFARAARI